MHTQSGCQVALAKGRYRWQHDKVLRELTDVLEVEKKTRKRPSDSKQRQLQFLKQGESTLDTRAPRRTSSLDRGNDWELRVDLDRKLVFPTIWETNLRPDAMSVSKHSKMPRL